MADYSSPAPMSLSQPRHVASDDDSSDDRNATPRATTSSKSLRRPSSSSDLPKKPRGRPPGSKNKPKPPLVITKEVSSSEGGAASLSSVVLEISAGADVVDSLVKFAVKRSVCLALLSGTGSVSNVTLRHPLSPAPTTVSLHGPFSLLSVSGSVLVDSSSKPSFGIMLAGAQGQIFGGVVGGKVVAASPVVVVAATFSSPSFHRLSGEEESESKPSGEVYCSSGGVASPAAVNCVLPSPTHHTHVMPGWGHTARSPY